MMRRLWLLLGVLLIPSIAGAQGFIRYSPPGGGSGTWDGGTFTNPALAPAADNCAAIPYSFTSDTNTGLCTSAADTFNLYTAGASRLSGNSTALTSTVPILLPDGSATAPSLAFSDSVTTGLYNGAGLSGIIEFAANGVQAARLSANGFFMTQTAGSVEVSSGGKYSFNSGTAGGSNPDTVLLRDAANTLALRNSTNAQTFNLYGTYTDASNYERLAFLFGSSAFRITQQHAGSGGSRSIIFGVGNSDASGESYAMSSAAFAPQYGDANTLGGTGSGFEPWSTVYVTRSIQGSKSKALTDNTATAFVRVAIPQTIATNYKGGQVIYEIYCDNDTNQASQSGTVKFTCHNLAGTEACGFGTPEGVTLGDGTASLAAPTFDATSGAVDTIDLRVQSDCTGITPNTHTIEYRLDMPTTATITPQ